MNAPYEDIAALSAFARECEVVTYEFENVPAAPLRAIEGLTKLRPHWRVLETTQNRSREKNWAEAKRLSPTRVSPRWRRAAISRRASVRSACPAS
ncbi:MAG: hypothetical protein WDM96_17250 [Lacunisphaera sp.]